MPLSVLGKYSLGLDTDFCYDWLKRFKISYGCILTSKNCDMMDWTIN